VAPLGVYEMPELILVSSDGHASTGSMTLRTHAVVASSSVHVALFGTDTRSERTPPSGQNAISASVCEGSLHAANALPSTSDARWTAALVRGPQPGASTR